MPLAEAQAQRPVLEQGRRLSASRLWSLQRAFFEQQGLGAWRTGVVPHDITSNPFIAGAYARVVLAFARDLAAAGRLQQDGPLQIVELGGGSGRFAHQFLRAIERLTRHAPPALPLRYALTDLAAKNVASWEAHPLLRRHVEAGRLELCRFDAEHDDALLLRTSGAPLSRGARAGPLVVIANYFFDSIPQDAFRCVRGEVHEALPTLSAPPGWRELEDPRLIPQLRLDYQHSKAAPGYYGDASLDAVLESHRGEPDGDFLFPCAALRCLRRLAALSGDSLLLLAADRGDHRPIRLRAGGDFGLLHHGGAFSLPVSFDDLGRFFRAQGGEVLKPPDRSSLFEVAAFLLGGGRSGHGELRQAFQDAVADFGPADFHALKELIGPQLDSAPSAQLLALLRLGGWNTKLARRCLPALLRRRYRPGSTLAASVARAVEEIHAAHFPIGEDYDLSFDLGSLLYKLGQYGPAMVHFEESIARHGADAGTLYNLGRCCQHLGRREAARAYLDQAVALEPGFNAAAQQAANIRRELDADAT